MQRKVLGKILNELGLDEGSVDVAFYDDIYEHITDLVSDQFANIVGGRQRVIDGRVYDGTGAAGHWEDNPAGPSYEDFDHILERYGDNLGDVFSVDYDRMDIGEWHWEGYIRFDVEREFGEILHHDQSIIEEIITVHLESELRHPDWEVEFDGEDFQIRVYGGHISLEHEEYETGSMNDFEAFVNVMDGAAQDWPETKESITEDFKERGIIPGAAIGNLKVRFDRLNLEYFDVDIEDRELSIYTILKVKIPIPPHLYEGLTAGAPSWQSTPRAYINNSP